MKPKLDKSLQAAHRVFNLINISKEAASWGVTGYENGREHGLCLKAGPVYITTTICWSLYRNSDDIVVYVSEPGESFEYNTCIPTKRAYDTKTFFNYNEHAKAAKFISTAARRAVIDNNKEPRA